MSLLQDEEFVLYQLRTAYLSCIKDGVGERLINVNTSVLNNPAFRAAGWVPSAADIKRTYSPPIPTAVASEYFQAPRSAGLPGTSFGDDDDEGGMVTGGGGSNDTVGPALNTKRRRRKEQLGEDDSSDLSDESDDDFEAAQRAAQQIRFNKMPVRTRAGSSPLRSSNLKDGPALLVTSPSRPPESNQLRRGSLGAVEAFKQRARRDTTTSSEMSSENELDPSLFKRKQVNPQRAAQASHLLSQRIQEDERENETFPLEADPGAESDDSTLSSEFAGTADSESLLGRAHRDVANSSLPLRGAPIPPAMSPQKTSPKKSRPAPATLQALPPPRPISVIQPVSALTLALKAKDRKPVDPFERFATLSGKGDPNPLYIRVYAPFSTKPTKPYEMLVLRATISGAKVTVAEAIGLALYRYGEEKFEPAIEGTQKTVNRWNFRMIEDDEVDYDFPALTRNRPFTDFTSNNNRGARGRSREKPWDEFALVEASEKEFKENEALTPEYSKEAAAIQEDAQTDTAAPIQPQPTSQPPPPPGPSVSFHNPITGPSFAPTAPRKDGTNLLDAPAPQASHATPRTGAPRTLTVRFMNDDFVTRTTKIEATTDTYIAEVFSQACKVLGVDPAMFVLKVSGTNTVAPSDRTVEALGDRLTLDFQRRRFVGDGVIGIAGSPGSSSPNAPLLISSGGTPKKGKKGPAALLHPLAQKQDLFVALNTASYKRYAVTRKQPMSFSSSSSRILALDGEYMHIMPAENHPNTTNKIFEAPAKTTTVPFSSIVGSKVSRRHPRMFRVVVFKERETKRYDFEASSQAEAAEIVREIKKGVERFNEGVV